MVRKDKKNRKCICCNKTFATSQKLRQHYKSNKNQCKLTPDDIPKQASALETSSQKERPSVIERQDAQVINQTPDPEAGSGPSIQAHRKGLIGKKEHHDPKEARLPTLAKIEKLPLAERQEYKAQKEYASKMHFRSIYEEKDRTYSAGVYSTKIVQEEPPDGDIIFLERERDPAR
jgi:hypothetical protein